MTIEVAFTAAGDARDIVGTHGATSAVCSLEQIFSPIQISQAYSPSGPGFYPPASNNTAGLFGGGNVGPTVHELNPYFSTVFASPSSFLKETDYAIVVNDSNELNVRKATGSPAFVNTNAFRGPMIMSGWGFGMDDNPVPAGSSINTFNPDLVRNRAIWKTGPIHLMWDDQRQVWAGGHQIVCGVLSSSITPPANPLNPTAFTISLFRRTDGGISSLGETVTVINRDPSLEHEASDNVFVICVKINYEWLPLWVGCPNST